MLPIIAKQMANSHYVLNFKSRSIFSVLICLVTCAPVAVNFATRTAKSSARSDAITVRAAGRGEPYLHLQDGRQLQLEYQGDQRLVQALRSNEAQPRSLATADFDLDGAPDLVTGYNYLGSGILAVQRGNVDAFVPKDLRIYDRAAKGELPPSFLSKAEVIQLPEPADFILTEDINDDGRKDLVVAARGGGLYLLANDGHGAFGMPERLALPGGVTAIVSRGVRSCGRLAGGDCGHRWTRRTGIGGFQSRYEWPVAHANHHSAAGRGY